MTYPELIEYMHKYRSGELKRTEMIFAICLWQASVTGGFTPFQEGTVLTL